MVAASGTASWTAPGNFCSMRWAISSPVRTVVRPAALILGPLQRLLAPGVEQADEQYSDEGQDLDEPGDRYLREGDRPGGEEDRFNIEDHEQQRAREQPKAELH